MATHFKWYPGSDDVTIPFNARFSFPDQANKAVKMMPRINPKTGYTYLPGSQMRIELPAQGYMNTANSTLEFDVTLIGWGTDGGQITRFQNNIQSIFARIRILYGATSLEDIIGYNVVVRALTEWTGTNQGVLDQQTVADGVGGVVLGADKNGLTGLVNTRQKYIHGIDKSVNGTGVEFIQGTGSGAVPSSANGVKRRYQVHLSTGLFNQSKLIPLKFMASQFAIEITFENAAACMITQMGSSTGAEPTYVVDNVNFLPEILEFDASYDAVFLQGLRQGGIPILFSSWHTYLFSTGGSSNVNLMIQERSRSVKALFTVMRRKPEQMQYDSHALLFASGVGPTVNDPAPASSMQTYQYRIGGRYYPPSPVQLAQTLGSSITNGGAEAYHELEKALNIVGDYRLSTGCNATRWAMMPAAASVKPVGALTTATWLPELDYTTTIVSYNAAGQYAPTQVTKAGLDNANCFAGNLGSSCYVSAICLETSNGMEISGLNAEEQSDIAFLASWSTDQLPGFGLEVYSYYDSMIVLRENNVIELIQ